jgi:hypothetical protein
MTIISSRPRSVKIGPIGFAVIFNCAFWFYFWLSFAGVHPNDRFWSDHPVDPYVVFGHAIGLSKNPLSYGFMKAMFWVEFPSFCFTTWVQRMFSGIDSSALYLGVSLNGYRLVATMLASMVQWAAIAWLLQRLLRKRSAPRS